jgi:hypothetical protein
MELQMKIFTLVVFLLFSTFALATDMGSMMKHNEPLKLKDGSHLFIGENNEMHMVDKEGKPMKMKDGVVMELMDGNSVLMKNKLLYRHDHRKMK